MRGKATENLTAVVLHVRPDVPLLQTVGEGTISNVVALLLLHHMDTHLGDCFNTALHVLIVHFTVILFDNPYHRMSKHN